MGTHTDEHGGGLTRRALLTGGAACVLCAFGWGRPRPAAPKPTVVSAAGVRQAATTTPEERKAAQPDAIVRVPTDEPLVALTFDDGPDPRYTGDVLKLLKGHGAAATFFMIGVNALGYRDLVSRALHDGHGIANHTYDHRVLEGLRDADVVAEIERGTEAIETASGLRPWLFRPPKGYTDPAVGVVADARRYRTVFWDVCLENYLHRFGVIQGVEQALARVVPGSVILAHDGGHVLAANRPTLDRGRTVAALPALLEGLQQRGYVVTDVATLLRRSRVAIASPLV